MVAAIQPTPRGRRGRSGPAPTDEQWVLLAYRLPRVPSTPRSTVWRRLRRLGVVQVADGVVALPADARTREALEWIAEEVVDHDGDATIWLGRPADTAGRAALVERMNAAVDDEYAAVIAEANALAKATREPSLRSRARLRRELHRIEARDFFRAPLGETARRAVAALTTATRQEVRS
jgi:hypothetical protein